ncbi:hypothetical protein O7602_04940 [Micromonospora sp. WMMD1128]|uniref:hypothetical protein n=1 Tax=Micromonospora sp. WMMD1128 TaxID=3015150 RepID=UPI00248C3F35|nr:hypothetical protein [Micromonospora sp. WMMD1128]WBB74891.1 hypothetical protein O7602_04940 [Micromonospora sp. WMMD1128]
MTKAGLVLDTACLLAYSEGAEAVGGQLAKVADRGQSVIVPALCLAEAYRRVSTDGWCLLDILGDLGQVVVAPVAHDMCMFLGGWSRTLDSMDLAQTALEAARATTPIMTDRRELIGEVLPKEWPIIDL